MMEVLDFMLGWAKDNPALVLLCVWVLLQLYNRSRPFPEVEGSKVRNINSMAQFDELVQKCKTTGSVLVVDYYATWCPPCRVAAPVYGEMSKVYREEDVIFAKVNVDEARAVAQAHGIQAMPTFKLFNGEGRNLHSIQGWNESGLRDAIVKAVNSR